MIRLLIFSLLFMGLAACSHIPDLKKAPPGWDDVAKRGTDTLSNLDNSVIKIKLPRKALTVPEKTLNLPVGSDVQLQVEFNSVDLEKVLYLVSVKTGVNLYFSRGSRLATLKGGAASTPGAPPQNRDPHASGDQSQNNDVKSKKITLRFKGPLSDLLKTISENTGTFFLYENGTIMVSDSENFSVTVPSYPKLLEEIESSLSALGAKSIAYDRLTSTVNFNADFHTYKAISNYCTKLRNNASLVTLRILLLDVQLNADETSGIDWTKMVGGFGAQRPNSQGYSQTAQAASTASGTSSASSTTTTPTIDAASLGKTGASVAMSATGANLVMEGSKFSVSTMMNFMESYGHTTVLQNVFIESLSGTAGRIDALTETPYISEISFTSLSTQATLPSQAVKTDRAKDGVEMDIIPYYSRDDGSLTLSLKMSLLGVNQMVNLAAGSFGSMVQPETTKKHVETYLRMAPSQVAVIGGLVLDKSNGNVSGIPGETYLSKSVSRSKKKEELVIVVKPTILEFESE